MKIAFILPSLANKGPIVFTKYLINGLINHVEEISVYYFEDIVELDLGVSCERISFFKKITFDKFDIIHTTMAKPDLYAWFHLNNKKQINKWVVSMHNYYKEDLGMIYNITKTKILSFFWSIAFKSVKNIIVSSTEMKNYYENFFKNKNYKIIPYGINKKSLADIDVVDKNLLLALKTKFTIIGSVGLLIQRKGFAQLIDFVKNNDKYAIVIIGEGEQRFLLEQLAFKYNVNDRFILLGARNNSIDYYKYFDVYAMTSYSEGFGLAMLEAMSQALPVVCSKLEIYSEYFSEKDVSFFELDNTISLETSILKVTNNLKEYGKASYNLFETKFSLNVMAKSHIAYYLNIINKT